MSPITQRNGSRRPRSTGRFGADIRVCMALPQFAAMRKLAMSFRAILFGADPARSDARLTWRTPLAGITSGHSPNKLKTWKRSLFGHRTICRAWFIPIEGLSVH
jgi:hypothetical protein